MSKQAIHLSTVVKAFLLSLVFAALVPAVAFAATTIEPSGDTSGTSDRKSIQAAIDSGDTVVLQSGATYYTDANLKVKSGTTIEATGATIICVKEKSGAFRNQVKEGCYNYNSCVGVKVTGGYWKHVNPNGYQASLIQFTHASNITFKDLTAEGSFNHHAVEFIACKNVTMDGCTVKAVGKGKSTSAEESVQFDIATPKSAPTVLKNYGSKAVNGQVCQDIKVNNCKIMGSRGLTTNKPHGSVVDKYGNCHKNITITNSTIIGTTSEAVALFNAVGKINVSNNTIASYSTRTGVAYSAGLHIALFGKKITKTTGKSIKATIKNNTIKGGRQGMFIYSHAPKARMGTFTVTNNKGYAKKGKNMALVNNAGYGATKYKASKNKTYKWATKTANAEKTKVLATFYATVAAQSSSLKAASSAAIA